MVARVARLVDDEVVQRHKDVDGLFDRLMHIRADKSAVGAINRPLQGFRHSDGISQVIH